VVRQLNGHTLQLQGGSRIDQEQFRQRFLVILPRSPAQFVDLPDGLFLRILNLA
jgi:hypothetical protein